MLNFYGSFFFTLINKTASCQRWFVSVLKEGCDIENRDFCCSIWTVYCLFLCVRWASHVSGTEFSVNENQTEAVIAYLSFADASNSFKLTADNIRVDRKYICQFSGYLVFIARQHTDARYWYSNFVYPFVRLSVCLSVTFRYHMKTA